MSKQANPEGMDDVLEAESQLGQALAAIHRVLPGLGDAFASSEVQAGFKRASACLEKAKEAHQRFATARPVAATATAGAQAGIAGETVAAIAAAVSLVLGRPYRLLSVHKVPVPVPHLNVWALEGRAQIFQSRKVR